MKRFIWGEIIGLGVLGISLASCSGAIDPNANWNIDVNATKSEITLNTLFPNSGKSNEYFSKGYIPDAFEEVTGYKVIYNQTSNGGADTEVQAKLTGKEQIDMLKISETLFNNYVTDGYFADLTDGIEKYAPNLKSLSLITDEQWEACTYNGRIYAIPEVGHTSMVNEAMVWNMEHLAEVGITKMPSTLTEFTTAILALQEHFGSNANYHALALAGTRSEGNPLASSFEVPAWWYFNDDNEVQNMLFSDKMENYLSYMHTLASQSVIASGWSGQSETDCMSNMVNGNASCIVLPYWNVTPLRTMAISSYKGVDGNFQMQSETEKYNAVYGVNETEYGTAASDALFQWNKYILGDGSYNSPVQEYGISRESGGIAYYITIPVASASRAAYTLDWINYKQTEELTIANIAGKEGTHFEYTTADDPDAVKLNTLEGEEEEYVKILEPFYDEISGMSQYQTAVNPTVARKWWPIAEKGFDAWEVLQLDDSKIIYNPIGVHPVWTQFSKVDLKARNYVVTQLQNIINNGTETYLEKARTSYTSRYWKDAVKNEVNSWWQSKHSS